MQRKKVPAGHHRFGLTRLVLVLALLFLVVALTAGLAGCLFQPVLAARGTLPVSYTHLTLPTICSV